MESTENSIKLIKLINGQEVRGHVVNDTEKEMRVSMEIGELSIAKSDVISCVDILDCTTVNIGQFVQTPKGIYLKIDGGTFRLVKGSYTSQIDLQSIHDGSIIDYEDVFPDLSTDEPVA